MCIQDMNSDLKVSKQNFNKILKENKNKLSTLDIKFQKINDKDSCTITRKDNLVWLGHT